MNPLRRPVPLSLFFLAAASLPAFSAIQPGDFDLSFHKTGWTTAPAERNGFVTAMAVQSDGRLVLAGRYQNTSSSAYGIAVYRLLPDGSLDTTFNTTGAAFAPDTLQTNGGIKVAVQSDQKILVYGGRERTDTVEGGLDATLVRFLPDGALDSSFGPDGGSVTTRILPSRQPASLALQGDGKILITAHPSGLLRYLPDGTLDDTFGTHGVSTGETGGGFALTVQPDGKILTAGQGDILNVFRFHTDGTPDTSFGVQGRGAMTVGGSSLDIRCLAVQSDGKILAAGYYNPGPFPRSSGSRFLVARFLPDGTPDFSFNSTGWNDLFFFHGNPYDIASSLLVQDDGRIVIAGVARQLSGQSSYPLLARFHANGTLDTGFGSGGWLLPDFNNSQVTFAGAALLPDGKLLTTGHWGYGPLLVGHFHIGPWPGLSVEHQPRTPLTSHTPVPLNIGPVVPPSRDTVLNLRNTASAPLTNITVALTEESRPGEIVFTPLAVNTLAPGELARLIVTLTPSAGPGPRTAKLQIASSDPVHSPFVLPLTGSPATGLELWRVTHFGSPESSGPGADAGDPDHDGIPNLVEFGAGSHPWQRSLPTWKLERKGADFEFTYTRSCAATEWVSWVIESGSFPDSSWVNGAGSGEIVSSDGVTQTLKAFIPGNQFRYFVRLRVKPL